MKEGGKEKDKEIGIKKREKKEGKWAESKQR